MDDQEAYSTLKYNYENSGLLDIWSARVQILMCVHEIKYFINNKIKSNAKK